MLYSNIHFFIFLIKALLQKKLNLNFILFFFHPIILG